MLWYNVIFLSIWAAGHAYLARRFGEPFPAPVRRLVWIGFGTHFSIGLVAAALREFPDFEPFYSIAKWVYYLGMGGFFLVFSLVATIHLTISLHRGVHALRRRREHRAPVDPARRRFLLASANTGIVSVAAASTGWGLYQARKTPDLVEVTVPIPHLPEGLDGFRIVQLSDLHVGPTIRRTMVDRIAAVANDLDADLIAITGDLAEGRPEHILKDMEAIFSLQSRHGLFYCTGNHEYYWDGPGWCEALRQNGLVVLNNEHRLVEHQGGRLLVAGCTDLTAGQFVPDHATDPAGALNGAPTHDVSILLAHQPASIHEAARAGYDLQLSGHTHGGQFWPGSLVIDLFHPYAIGLHREDKTWIYVSRGTGYWGPPMRLKAPSEITVLTLVPGEPALADVRRTSLSTLDLRHNRA
jgi:uncharacterized protein